MEITRGVCSVDGVSGSNVYLITDDPMTLIDTGFPGNARAIIECIYRAGRDPKELAYVVLTHGHADHSGSAAALRRLTGARVVAHPGDVVVLADGTAMVAGHARNGRRTLSRLALYIARFEACHVDISPQDGELLPCAGGLRVVHLPGHTDGSMALLLERSRVLFAGDAIINNGNRLSRPLPFGSDASESERSLAKLAGLSFETCCFGHGSPLTSEAASMVRGLADRPPSAPPWRRVIRRRHDLASFWRRLHHS